MVPVSLLPCTKSVRQFLPSYGNLVNICNSCLVQILGVCFTAPSFYCAQYKNIKTLEVPSATRVSGILLTYPLQHASE